MIGFFLKKYEKYYLFLMLFLHNSPKYGKIIAEGDIHETSYGDSV